MVTLNVNDSKYVIPERFTVSQWQQMQKWGFDVPEFWPRIIAVATGADPKLLEQADSKSIELVMAFIIANLNRRKEFKVMDFSQITFGQFVDLDCWLQMGIDKHIVECLDLLSGGTEWADEALWVLDKYTEFRQHILRQYAELFGLNDDAAETEGQEQIKQDPLKVARAWYAVLVQLADEDVLKMDLITDEPLKKILNFMAYKKEQQIAAHLEQLKQRSKHIQR